MQTLVQSIHQFTTTPKIKVLVHLYPGKVVVKLVFENNVFAKINLRNSKIFLYECLVTMLIVILFPFT